jgi:multiple sugar transport system substrate-binding protein
MQTGDLPTRQSVGQQASLSQQMNASLPGVATFIANLGNVRQARPQIPQYPKISQILGTMIVSVLLGQSQPQTALKSAAAQVNQALATG